MWALALMSSNPSFCNLVKWVPQLAPRESGQGESRIPAGKTPNPANIWPGELPRKKLAWSGQPHTMPRGGAIGTPPGQATNPSGQSELTTCARPPAKNAWLLRLVLGCLPCLGLRGLTRGICVRSRCCLLFEAVLGMPTLSPREEGREDAGTGGFSASRPGRDIS